MAKITLHEHAGGKGNSLTLYGDDLNLRDNGWNDEVSSVTVGSGTWKLYLHVNHTGDSTDPLGPGFHDLSGVWNDEVSSVDLLIA